MPLTYLKLIQELAKGVSEILTSVARVKVEGYIPTQLLPVLPVLKSRTRISKYPPLILDFLDEILAESSSSSNELIEIWKCIFKNSRARCYYSDEFFANFLDFHSNKQFRDALRPDKRSFTVLIRYIKVKLSQISRDLEFKFIILFYYLTRPITIRDLGENIGIPKSTVFSIICQMVSLFNTNNITDFINLPSVDELEGLSNVFKSYSRLEGTIIAIDGTYAEIEAPKNLTENYFNMKQRYSLNFLLAFDHNRKVRYVFGGMPGSNHDSHIFRLSKLYNWIDDEWLGSNHNIGDGAYMNHIRIKKPFIGELNNDQRIFNYELSAQKIVAECGINDIKSIFRKFKYSIPRGETPKIPKCFLNTC